ncbi:helix-turn-helix transcriptional regulator [Limnohabitans sp. Rim8]|uniref:helix-turn-helix domain-containing protein n=1 Tax=Limnohabitans sp. Rim8 TaxID=1100718 RepID=UPI003305C243
MNPTWSETDAQKFKAMREDAGLEVAALAKLFALSVAQVHELEDGGQECFYSPVIKARVGRKLLRFLAADGGDPMQSPHLVDPTYPNSEWQRSSAVQELEKVAALANQNLETSLQNRIRRAFNFLGQACTALAVIILLILLILLVLLLVPILKEVRPAVSIRPAQISLFSQSVLSSWRCKPFQVEGNLLCLKGYLPNEINSLTSIE